VAFLEAVFNNFNDGTTDWQDLTYEDEVTVC